MEVTEWLRTPSEHQGGGARIGLPQGTGGRTTGYDHAACASHVLAGLYGATTSRPSRRHGHAARAVDGCPHQSHGPVAALNDCMRPDAG
jgi:hypothetical protein